MNRKKLIIIHHCGTIGGSGRSLLQTVNMLSEKYDISVLCPADSQMSVFLTDNNIDVIPYSFRLGSLSYYSGGPDIFGRTFLKKFCTF